MRDLLLVGIFLGILPYAIRRPWVGVLLWTWVSIMNPHRLAFGFAHDAPFAAVAAGITFLGLFMTRDKVSMPSHPSVKLLLAFFIWMCITTAFAFFPVASWDQLKKVWKILLMTGIAFAVLRERKHIELFIWVNVLSIGFYGFKGGIFTIRSGGGEKVWGPAGSFIEGNNEIGLALVAIIPLMNYLRMVSTRGWIRLGLLVLMLLSATAALGTQSRGAFLAIAAMAVVLWIRTKRKVIGGALITLSAVALLAFMPASWEERMRTIGNYEEDGSAMGRINAWWMAFRLANDHLFGGGFEIYTGSIFARYAPMPNDVHAAHSIYFQVLGEHGYVGLILFLLIWFFAFQTAGKLRKQALKRDETQWLHHLAGMCQVSLVGYAVGGAFLSLAYFDLPYNILVTLVVSLRWLQGERWETEPQGAFASAAPVSQIRAAARTKVQQWS
ncbi:MAG: putative O-glycosylation ligase, exosortase A system-associated [Rhodoferax sp.]|uniref:putative O-glycosylation ligase, exosortase A system-associated n=1 Tax=Rhodoferax sp. TaxID=50421 RepID=UPI002721A5AE|nr:putative O-glycosylation ligase, exosortase A system-associated [Rhodoferax sp.]MDO8450866.1 putative O-glycosylation ligase, exosortase A system-associated [Rhodoferax sp.]